MWYQIYETDIPRLRTGDLLMKHSRPVSPELMAEDHNEFFILESMDKNQMCFKKADIIQSSINYSFTSFAAKEFFNNTYWYCFEKRSI